ncbi:MAG: mechanosensitive ion channel family protein [Pseudomonadota bacterium]
MRKLFWPALLLLFLSCWGNAALAAQPSKSSPPPQPSLTDKEIQTLLNLFEDEAKRKDFLEGLKALQKARVADQKQTAGAKGSKAGGTATVPGIDVFFDKMEELTKQLHQTLASFKNIALETPGALTKAADALSDSESRRRVWTTFAALFAPLFLSWVFSVGLKRFVPSVPEDTRGILRRTWLEAISLIAAMAPYLLFLVLSAALSQILGIFRLARDLITILAMVLVFYNLALHLLKVILEPDSPGLRLAPLKDEEANYLYIWLARFGNFCVVYFLTVEGLRVAGLDYTAHAVIRGGLLLVFPLMLTAFILQLRREINTRFMKLRSAPPAPESTPDAATPFEETIRGRLVFFILRFWWLPALIYVWAIFILMIIRYKSGFSYLISSTYGTIGVTVGLFLVLTLNNFGFKKLFAVGELVRIKFPGLEQKTDRYLKMTEAAFQGLIVLLGLFSLAQVWGLPVAAAASSEIGSLLITRTAAIVLTAVGVVVVLEISRLVMAGLLEVKNGVEPSQKRKTFVPLFRTALVAADYFVGGVVILEQLGVNVGPILAGAGIVGLGVGLGAQSLVKDFINGLFILIQDMINVGDWVQLGDRSGLVESIGLRAVTIRDAWGSVHIIPNSAIETVTNMTKGFSRYILDVGVAYREDIDEVMELLGEIGREMQADPVFGPDILEPLDVMGLHEFGDSAVIVRARVTTKPMKQWAVGREFNRRIKKAFDLRGIEIPFPHQTIYMGEPKKGPAPPLQMRIIPEQKPGPAGGPDEDGQ